MAGNGTSMYIAEVNCEQSGDSALTDYYTTLDPEPARHVLTWDLPRRYVRALW